MSKHVSIFRTFATQLGEYDAEIEFLELELALGSDDTAGYDTDLWKEIRCNVLAWERDELLNAM